MKTVWRYGFYRIDRLSDHEYSELFNEDKEYQYSFRMTTENLKDSHEIYALRYGDKDIASLAIEYLYTDDLLSRAIFIVGFQRNKFFPEFKGQGSILLEWVIDTFKSDSEIFLYPDTEGLEKYYSEFGFVVCDSNEISVFERKYGFTYLDEYLLMRYGGFNMERESYRGSYGGRQSLYLASEQQFREYIGNDTLTDELIKELQSGNAEFHRSRNGVTEYTYSLVFDDGIPDVTDDYTVVSLSYFFDLVDVDSVELEEDLDWSEAEKAYSVSVG